MSNSRIIAIIAGIVLFVAVCTGLFLFFFEAKYEDVRSGYSIEALRNPFLAAKKFLDDLGYESEVIKGNNILDELPPESDILVAIYNHGFENKSRREKILGWIDRGGHLILELSSSEEADDVKVETPFLDELGVQGIRSNLLFSELTREQLDIRVYENSETLTVEFDPQYSIKTERDDTVLYFEDKNGAHLIELNVGHGAVTILSDIDLWRNRQIGQYDHAAALAHIIGANPGKIWFLRNIQVPTILELMWKHGRAAVISGSFLLIVFLWHMNNRFGPIIQIHQQQRRSLLEHLDAVGLFDWRFNRAGNLLDATRKELHLYIERHHPHWQKKSTVQQCEWLAERTKLPAQEIMQALTSLSENQTGFTRYMRILQTIRNSL